MTAEQLQTASGLPRKEARALLAHALGVTRERLISHSELDLSHADAEVFFALVARRLGGEPLAYLTGIQEFYGRRFSITPDVLVPRPDTETLIDVALDCIRVDRRDARPRAWNRFGLYRDHAEARAPRIAADGHGYLGGGAPGRVR